MVLLPTVCLCPNKDLGRTNQQWAICDSYIARISVERDLDQNMGRFKGLPVPKELGLRPIKSAFEGSTSHYFDNHRTIGTDKLHLWLQGIFGRMWLPVLQGLLQPLQIKAIDRQYISLPRYPNLKHYAQGIFGLKWRSGNDHAVIAKTITPILDAILPATIQARSDLLLLFRTMGVCTILLGLSTQSDVTIEKLEGSLRELDQLEQKLQPTYAANMTTVKHHLLHTHVAQSIREKGPLINTDTSHGEARHPESKKDYTKTNRHGGEFQLQMMRKALHRETIRQVRERVNATDGTFSPSAALIDKPERQHVVYGSKHQVPRLRLEAFLTSDPVLGIIPQGRRDDLPLLLRRFLHFHFPSIRVSNQRNPPAESLPALTSLKVRRQSSRRPTSSTCPWKTANIQWIKYASPIRGGRVDLDTTMYSTIWIINPSRARK
ncbi:hypothetical protein FRC17_006489 [Serendipita sp. 399]|nr:hypothetical protein FRC17_006489 [Serendipita sp. 399]